MKFEHLKRTLVFAFYIVAKRGHDTLKGYGRTDTPHQSLENVLEIYEMGE